MQEKILEIQSAVNEERDLRQEAVRQERQKLMDAKDEWTQEQKNVEREVARFSTQMAKQFDGEARRAKEVDMTLANLTDKTDSTRADLANETLKRETDLRNLEQRTLEVQGLLSAEMKERRDMDADLRKDILAESASREAANDAERRARESGDLQVANTWKAALRDERESREAEGAQIAREFTSVKTQMAEENGQREDERSQQHLVIQKIKSELAELQGERKVDVVSMREAFGQVTEELKVAQRARKEDVDRLDATLGTVSARVDGNARLAREQSFGLEQQVQQVQSELQKEIDERTGVDIKLDARIVEEHRFTETSVAAESKCREDSIRVFDENMKQRLQEEVRKQKVVVDKMTSQIITISDDLEKDRPIYADNARETAKHFATLQGMIGSEEQARQQHGWHLQQCVDLAREEVGTEAKERRGQCNALAEDVQLLQRGLQKRDDRSEAIAKQLNAESNDLRERIIRETRLRETAVGQLEQQMANAQSAKEGVPTSHVAMPSGPSTTEWSEYKRAQDEEMERQRRTLLGVQSEQQGLGKAVGILEDRYDSLRAGVGRVESSIAEVQTRQKTLVEMEALCMAARDELRKEASERRAEDERLASAQVESTERLERAEQQRIKSENEIRQEVLDTKATLKKEVRDRELADTKLSTLVREEAQQREEACDREARLRQEGLERTSDAFHGAVREERKVREKEDLRLEGRSLAGVGGPGGPTKGYDPSSAEGAGWVMEQRAIRQSVGDLQDRATQNEVRQRNAEERTVSMLDAIMSGLTGPAESD